MQRFMIAWPSFPESFSFFHTWSRKRLMRPSSRPWARPLRLASRRASYAPALRLGTRYLASSSSVFGQSCQ